MDHKRRKMLTSYKIWKLEKMGINNIITWKPKYIGHVKCQSDLERTAMKDVVLGRRVRTEMDTGQWRHLLFWGAWDGTDNQLSLLGWPWCVASCEGLTSWWRVARLNIPQGKSEKVSWIHELQGSCLLEVVFYADSTNSYILITGKISSKWGWGRPREIVLDGSKTVAWRNIKWIYP